MFFVYGSDGESGESMGSPPGKEPLMSSPFPQLKKEVFCRTGCKKRPEILSFTFSQPTLLHSSEK
jgi:hypothetical protein